MRLDDGSSDKIRKPQKGPQELPNSPILFSTPGKAREPERIGEVFIFSMGGEAKNSVFYMLAHHNLLPM